ncbi:hypothetical protein F4818DRAFT_425003 [Hypoxylon cercidicola]|nr:hypothetical protein F4818DRAFT_425003 [Hypoxylon cercidicola]
MPVTFGGWFVRLVCFWSLSLLKEETRKMPNEGIGAWAMAPRPRTTVPTVCSRTKVFPAATSMGGDPIRCSGTVATRFDGEEGAQTPSFR